MAYRKRALESPHNFYVQTLLRGGALGLLALIALHGILLRGLLQHAKQDEAARPILLCMAVLIASQLVLLSRVWIGLYTGYFSGLGNRLVEEIPKP